MNDQKLELTQSPIEFFREKIHSALHKQRIEISQDVEYYLVTLMCDFIVPDQLVTRAGSYNLFDTPVALIYKAAVEAPYEEKLKIYKTLGDTSLYISGYFQDYFNRKTYGVDYFIGIGANAYINVADLSRESSQSGFTELYKTLAKSFSCLVDIFAEVSEQLSPQKNSSLLAIYDRWLKTPSARLRNKLEEQGITPLQLNSKLVQ